MAARSGRWDPDCAELFVRQAWHQLVATGRSSGQQVRNFQGATMSSAGPLRVGMVGYAFMGAAHSQAWRTAPRFFDLPRTPELTALAGRNAVAAQAAADRMGWGSVETDWRRLIEREDIDLIDICTPGDTHAEIAIAALEAGKHVLCEKPLANSVAEAEQMTEAAQAAAAKGVFAMCGFTYRRTPALALVKRMIAQGKGGAIPPGRRP